MHDIAGEHDVPVHATIASMLRECRCVSPTATMELRGIAPASWTNDTIEEI